MEAQEGVAAGALVVEVTGVAQAGLGPGPLHLSKTCEQNCVLILKEYRFKLT